MSAEVEKVVPQNSRTGRLLRFLFSPPRLGSVPPTWVATDLSGVAIFNRLADRWFASHEAALAHIISLASGGEP